MIGRKKKQDDLLKNTKVFIDGKDVTSPVRLFKECILASLKSVGFDIADLSTVHIELEYNYLTDETLLGITMDNVPQRLNVTLPRGASATDPDWNETLSEINSWMLMYREVQREHTRRESERRNQEGT